MTSQSANFGARDESEPRCTRAGDIVLDARRVSKTFGSVRVLRDLDFDVHSGEVHALVGQNGSGKSTFLKILSGYQACDHGGKFYVSGNEVSSHQIRTSNVAFVHQDLGFIEDATVLENLVAGAEGRRRGIINWRRERIRARDALARFGLGIDPETYVREIGQVDRAMLAIMRASLALDPAHPGVLVLDEPTAYLPRDGVSQLLKLVSSLTDDNKGVIFVTHHLSEVLAIADRVSVLRDGALVATVPVTGLTEDQIVELMLGSKLDSQYAPRPSAGTKPSLGVVDLRSEGLGPISFQATRGEIVGLTGLVGAGWELVPYCLFGADPAASGSLTIGEAEFGISGLTPPKARAAGLAMVPANRLRDSAVVGLSVAENLTVANLNDFRKRGVLSLGKIRRAAKEQLELFDVRPRDVDAPMGSLSGGNQQKVIMAKWLAAKPTALILHEPTQGVDVGARRQIHRAISQAAADGITVILVSAEHEDLAEMCHRVLVMRAGTISAEFSGNGLTESSILRAATA